MDGKLSNSTNSLKYGMSFDDALICIKNLNFKNMTVNEINAYLSKVSDIGLDGRDVAKLKSKIIQNAGFSNFDVRANQADVIAFANMEIKVNEYTEAQLRYRRGYENENPLGRWWTNEKKTIEQTRDGLAVCESWGNPLQGEYVIEVPVGTKSLQGTAEKQVIYDVTGNIKEIRNGGAYQEWFNEIPDSWKR